MNESEFFWITSAFLQGIQDESHPYNKRSLRDYVGCFFDGHG